MANRYNYKKQYPNTITIKEIAATLPICEVKVQAIIRNRANRFPKPIQTIHNNRIYLYCKTEIEEWLKNNDILSMKADYSPRKKRVKCLPFPEKDNELAKSANAFFSILNKKPNG
jgi:predicted DNA-binding transcriptional regulator AlpA